jgi:type IV secretory pathway VirB4 component
VISGRASSVERLHTILAQVGTDPVRWLPEFTRQVM